MADDKKKPLKPSETATWQEWTSDVEPLSKDDDIKTKTDRFDTTVEEFDNSPPIPDHMDEFEALLDGKIPLYPKEQAPVVDNAPLTSSKPQPVYNKFVIDSNEAHQLSGWRGGMDNKIRKNLAAGKIRPTARVDLHGHYLLDAYQVLREFIEQSQNDGHKCVLVVHGKGEGVQQNMGVIKQNIGQFLADIPSVLAYHSATPRDGGSGACYVLLHRKNKTP